MSYDRQKEINEAIDAGEQALHSLKDAQKCSIAQETGD